MAWERKATAPSGDVDRTAHFDTERLGKAAARAAKMGRTDALAWADNLSSAIGAKVSAYAADGSASDALRDAVLDAEALYAILTVFAAQAPLPERMDGPVRPPGWRPL